MRTILDGEEFTGWRVVDAATIELALPIGRHELTVATGYHGSRPQPPARLPTAAPGDRYFRDEGPRRRNGRGVRADRSVTHRGRAVDRRTSPPRRRRLLLNFVVSPSTCERPIPC